MIATGTLGSLHVTPMLTGIRVRSRLPFSENRRKNPTVSKETRSGASQGDEMGERTSLLQLLVMEQNKCSAVPSI